jgi:hypothetical protein
MYRATIAGSSFGGSIGATGSIVFFYHFPPLNTGYSFSLHFGGLMSVE